MKKIILMGGGTISHIRNHLALCAPAYGQTVSELETIIKKYIDANDNLKNEYEIKLIKTKMANGMNSLETNEDVEKYVDELIKDTDVKIIIFNMALVDFNGQIGDVISGKYAQRLETRDGDTSIQLTPTNKIIGKIRKERKDIFVVGFKTTSDKTSDVQYKKGLELLKKNSLNLVLANDTVTRNNIIIAPEETRYSETNDRSKALHTLIEIVLKRSTNTFTRSTVLEGPSIDWNSNIVPENLRTVVNHCIKHGAYKPVFGKTAGHFAVKINDGEILTSIRKTNFNELDKIGLVRVEYDGVDTVIAHGAKPSVGGMSQRIIFSEHPEAECIVHFHCPTKKNIDTLAWNEKVPKNQVMNDEQISIRPQIWNECGSFECGKNTSDGLAKVNLGDGDYIKSVYLDSHGPNIVFSKSTPANKIIDYIDRTFDLSNKTGGLVYE